MCGMITEEQKRIPTLEICFPVSNYKFEHSTTKESFVLAVLKDFEAFESTKRGLGHRATFNRSMWRDPGKAQREDWKTGTKKLSSPLASPGLGAAFFHSLIKYGGVPTRFQALLKPRGYAGEHYRGGH